MATTLTYTGRAQKSNECLNQIAFGSSSGAAGGQTLSSQLLAASSSYTIPAGSNYQVSFITGTGTFNGAAVAAPFSRSGKTAANIVVTTNAASTAYIDTSS